ncbi:MAG: sigma-54 dependent transcriptional regulator [Gemmatimonadota bacterium]
MTRLSDQKSDALKILVIDDEEGLARSCAQIARAEGHEVHIAHRADEGRRMARAFRPEIVLCDVVLPDANGLDILKDLRAEAPDALVIMITGFATVDASVEALDLGAYDYIPKPFTAMQLRILLGRASIQARLARDNRRLRAQLLDGGVGSDRAVGSSPAMLELMERVRRVAATEASVLISGESGTGKELVARALHANSARAEHPFVAVNCAAVPSDLLESELFGHVEGAFTGAREARVGLMESAAGGTFFLDEICEMGNDLQAKMLRALQERRVRPVGGRDEVELDIRVLAATNRDPEQAVRDGLLRDDLYFRLNVVPIRVPALRDRRDDVELLAAHFLERFCARYGRRLTLTGDAIEALRAYRWPGNVRELQNAIERVVSLAVDDASIDALALPPEIRAERSGPAEGAEAPSGPLAPYHVAKEGVVDRFERLYLRRLLDEHGGNVSAAARTAGLSRRTVHRLLAKHELDIGVSGSA